MIIHLAGEVNPEMLDKLIEAYNKLEYISVEKQEILIIYFSSGGGDNSSSSAIIQLINSNKDKTIVYAYDKILSNGFKIFYEIECKKDLIEDIVGMYHLTVHPGLIHYEGGKDKDDYNKFAKLGMKNYYYLDKVHSLVNFTDKELEDIKDHKDTWFNYKRLKTMLKYNNKQ